MVKTLLIEDNIIETVVCNTVDKGIWHLLQCKPREEQRAYENLQNQGYSIYLPEIHISKKNKTGYSEVLTPLFPGYLFIKLNKQIDNWAPIRSTRGVNKLVSFGPSAAIVPNEIINSIKQRTFYKNNKESYPFKKDEELTITSGPFKELQAVFDCRNGQQRAWVFIELMGQLQRIVINDIELNKVA